MKLGAVHNFDKWDMEIAFHTKSLRSLCEVDTTMRQTLGPIAAEALRICLADLRAAPSLSDIGSSYAARILSHTDLEVVPTSGLEIVLRAIAPKGKPSATPQWGTVTRVKIMKVKHRG